MGEFFVQMSAMERPQCTTASHHNPHYQHRHYHIWMIIKTRPERGRDWSLEGAFMGEGAICWIASAAASWASQSANLSASKVLFPLWHSDLVAGFHAACSPSDWWLCLTLRQIYDGVQQIRHRAQQWAPTFERLTVSFGSWKRSVYSTANICITH